MLQAAEAEVDLVEAEVDEEAAVEVSCDFLYGTIDPHKCLKRPPPCHDLSEPDGCVFLILCIILLI